MNKSVKSFLFRSMRYAFIGFILLVVGLAIAVYQINKSLPSVDELKDMHLEVPLRIMTADGKLMAEYGDKQRNPVALSKIPQPLINAVLAVEDARYYHHSGVDIIGLARAGKAVLMSGHKVQGASTITMQVARNFFLSRKKTYFRKIREIILAIKMDHELSKNKVLELYLNKVYFGHRAYGVAAAAQVYYGKKLDQLTLPQVAMLAGLPQAPSRNNPLTLPQAAKYRRDHVLKRMWEVGFITKQRYLAAAKAPVTATYHHRAIEIHAPYLADVIRQRLLKQYGNKIYSTGWTVTTTMNSKFQHSARVALESGLLDFSRRHGYAGAIENWGLWQPSLAATWAKNLANIPTHNLIIPAAVTTVAAKKASLLLADGSHAELNWSSLSWARSRLPALSGDTKVSDFRLGPKPKQATDVLNVGDVVWLQHRGKGWILAQIPNVQGAIVSINPKNGAILALSGGYDYNLSKFDRATQALRQPGSSFKPFIYSAALSKGFTLSSIINDAPIVLDGNGENKLWRPRNDTLKFYGPTRLRVGLEKSRNLVSVRLLRDITIPYALSYLKRFGFGELNLPPSLSLALGSVSLSPFQLASGYAVIANGGFRIQPHFVKRIENEQGGVVVDDEFPQACDHQCMQQVKSGKWSKPVYMAKPEIAPDNIYIMTQALRGVIQHGTGRAALVLKRADLAGKTGTTNEQHDAWFAGFNDKVVCVTWVGYDDLGSLYEYGSKAALPIWIDYMRDVLAHQPESTMPMPNNIALARIDPKTGLLAAADQKNAIFEYFRRRNIPTHYANSDTESINKNLYISVSKKPEQNSQPLF